MHDLVTRQTDAWGLARATRDRKQRGDAFACLAMTERLACLAAIVCTTNQPQDAASCNVQGTVFYLALGQAVDKGQEKARLEKELAYARGFLAGVVKKLNNDRFVQQAPAQVVALERKKQADAKAKCQLLEKQLAQL